jgi:hypothetical protein
MKTILPKTKQRRIGQIKPIFKKPRLIAVDVDGTLRIRSGLNMRLVEYLREKKAEGYRLMLWSMRGEKYARTYADTHGIAEMFDVVAGKPGYIIDDVGWSWIKYTAVIRKMREGGNEQES